MTSIITNNSAMTALKVLRQTESALGVTQERISTGLKVNSAKDDASTWAISQGIKSDVAAFKTMGEGLTMATSAISTASKAAASINDQITTIKQKIAQAKAPGADKVAIQASIDAALGAISNITANASFNGTNLVDNNNTLKVLASTSRDSTGAASANYIDVQGVNLGITNGGGLAALDNLKVTRDAVVTGSSSPQTTVDLTAGTTAGTIAFNYKTSSGESKTVTLNVAAAATAASMGTSFVQTFGDQLKADGLEVTADATTGDLTINQTKAGAQLISVTPSAGTVATTAQKNSVSLAFTNANLSVGDEFRFSVNAGGVTKTTVLRVTSDPTNALLGKDSDGNDIVGLAAANLTSAAAIATNVAAGLNLVTATFAAGAAVDGSVFQVTSPTAGTLKLESADNSDFVTNVTLPEANFADLLDRVESAATIARSAAQAFGTAESQAEAQKDFLKNLVDSLETGVGALIDADITAESARLNALQTQQQLATQSLSIANQGSQLVLSLFR